MGENSKIEWTHHTFNPWIGCTKISAGCTNCYASVSTFTRYKRSKGIELWGPKAQRHKTSEDNWKEPIRWNRKAQKEGTRYRVFCASLADVFEGHENPETDALMQLWRVELFALIDATPWLDWLLLTKRPNNIRAMWPGGYRQNVWLMTSVEDQAAADSRIPDLLGLRDLCPVLGLSMEPLVGSVDLEYPPAIFPAGPPMCCDGNGCGCAGQPVEPPLIYGIDWVILGGESGHGARPMYADWAYQIRNTCKRWHVPFFFKQWGEWMEGATGVNGFKNAAMVDRTGKTYQGTDVVPRGVGAILMSRVGKAKAGRELSQKEWNELPTPRIPVENNYP